MTDEVEIKEEAVDAVEERSEEVSVASEASPEIVEEAVEVEVPVETEIGRKAVAEITHRSMSLEMKPIDEEKRTVRIAVSSEEPVQRSFGMEVLEHSEDAIDLTFLNSGRAPLLLDHNPEKQVGVIESATLDGETRRLRAVVRFGKNGLANEAFQDVTDGIRANISVGYNISKLERGSTKDTYVAKRWKPMEASLVSIPADVTVGVGRAASETQPKPVIETNFTKETIMSEVDIAAVEAQARQAAQKDAAQIVELGARHGRSDLAQKAIAEGRSIEQFRGELLDVIGSKRALEDNDIGMSKKEVKNYSLIRLINALANPNDKRAQEAAAFELEASRAAADKARVDPKGVMLPADLMRSWAVRGTLDSAGDADLFSDDYRPGEFIDILRNQSSVMRAGARTLNGLNGDVVIPKKATGTSATWVNGEATAATATDMTFGNVRMEPRQLAAYIDVTRQLRQQSAFDVEALIRDDLAASFAVALDLAALTGSGAAGQPTGLMNQGISQTTDWVGAAPTYAEIVAMETLVANNNALEGNLSYITTTALRGTMKTTEKASGTAQFLTDGSSLNGYNLIASNQMTAGRILFGNFSDLLVGFWSGLDLMVDPYSLSTTGNIRVVAFQTCDVAVRRTESFAYGANLV